MFFIDAFEGIAHATGADKVVHKATGGSRLVTKDGKVTATAFVEDVAHHHGIDKIVHEFTGGKRVMNRDGSVNKEFLKTIEDACHDTGLDMIVHIATGGNRIVRKDGSFDAEGMMKVAASVAALAVDVSGTVATSRACAQIQKKMIEGVMNAISEKVSGDLGRDAHKIYSAKNAVDGMMNTVNALLSEVPPSPSFASALLAVKDIPQQLKDIQDALNIVAY